MASDSKFRDVAPRVPPVTRSAFKLVAVYCGWSKNDRFRRTGPVRREF